VFFPQVATPPIARPGEAVLSRPSDENPRRYQPGR
jgi:hypothetical protein